MTASTSEAGGGADAGAAAPRESFKDIALRTLSAAGRAIAQLASGLNTAVLAALLLFWLALTAVTSVVGVGLLMAPAPLRALHALAGRERDRLARWGPEVVAPQPPPTRYNCGCRPTGAGKAEKWQPYEFTGAESFRTRLIFWMRKASMA